MKDTKFIFLLILIIAIGLINILWLAKLQTKYNKLSTLKAEDLFDGITLRVSAIETNLLQIFDENNTLRMNFNAFGPTASIDIFDADGLIKFEYFDFGPGENGRLILHSEQGAFIEFNTQGHSPTIDIHDKAGKWTRFGSYGIIEF